MPYQVFSYNIKYLKVNSLVGFGLFIGFDDHKKNLKYLQIFLSLIIVIMQEYINADHTKRFYTKKVNNNNSHQIRKYQNTRTNWFLPKSTKFRKSFPKSSFRVISSDRHWFSEK